MRKPYLSIIIPVLNLWNLTKDCLQSIHKNTKGRFFEVIVVDNGSTDETPVECSGFGLSLFGERFKYIRMEKNINFGPGCNYGAGEAEGELLFFLNNDTLATENWASPLLTFFSKGTQNSACAPVCVFPDSGRIQHLGIAFDGRLSLKHPYFLFPADHPVVFRKRSLQALSASAFMIPAKTFRDYEGFYPEYANGFEDIDLCCRLRRKRGTLHILPESRIGHLASQTPGRNNADSGNLALINQRCLGSFEPDLHRIALDDGYQCEFTPWLEMIMKDPEVDGNQELEELFSEAEIISALERYPLWGRGYDRVSELLEGEERLGEALEYAYLGAFNCPDVERMKRVATLADILGNSRKSLFARQRIDIMHQAMNYPSVFNDSLVKIKESAEEFEDDELIRICKRWLRDYGLSNSSD